MKLIAKQWILLSVLVLGLGRVAQCEQRHEDHESLRAMLKTVTEAMNKRDLDRLTPLVLDKVAITTLSQKRFTSLAGFKEYFDGLFSGPNPLVKEIVFRPEADELTTFLNANTGVSSGSSNDRYTFANGDVREMMTRWTVTVVKDKGLWKLASLHISGNVLDNPILDALKKKIMLISVVSLAIGFFLGFFIGKRRRRVAA